MIVHGLGTAKRRIALRFAKGAITRVLCLSSEMRRFLVNEIGLPSEKVHVMHNWVDQQFFHGSEPGSGDYVLSAGMEARDYPTLRDAASGMPMKFHIVASGFSRKPGYAAAQGAEPKDNVTVGTGYSYVELRNLYAGARLFVMPLYPVTYAAGVTSVLEAMAMSKPVIVSDSPGIRDYVKDGASGLLVRPGNAAALRSAIAELWNDRFRLEAMGRYNRAWVETELNTAAYVNKVCKLIE
jgi:glycosyltransferase involved in cell wall biosynthesis